MSIAVWTDANGKVERIHYQPADVDTSDAHMTDKTVPDANEKMPDWVDLDLHYDEATDSFKFQKQEDPFAGLAFTDAEKQDVFDAVQENDLVKIRNIVETALQS